MFSLYYSLFLDFLIDLKVEVPKEAFKPSRRIHTESQLIH